MWLHYGENLAKRDSNQLPASERRVLLTRSVADAVEAIEERQKYRFRLHEIPGTAMTTDGSGQENITLEGFSAPYCLMDGEDHSGPEGTGGNDMTGEKRSPDGHDGAGGNDGANGYGGSEGTGGESGDGGAGWNGYAVRHGGDPNID